MGGEPPFCPFDVTLRIETREEYVLFHDFVATKIAQSSQFIGDVFRAGNGCRTTKWGDVPLKAQPQEPPQ